MRRLVRERAERREARARRPAAPARSTSAVPMCWPRMRLVDDQRADLGDVGAERRQLGAADHAAVRSPATMKRARASRHRRASAAAGGRPRGWRRSARWIAATSSDVVGDALKRHCRVHDCCLRDGRNRALLEQRQRFVDLLGRDDVRRQQPDDGVRRAIDEQPALQRRVDDRQPPADRGRGPTSGRRRGLRGSIGRRAADRAQPGLRGARRPARRAPSGPDSISSSRNTSAARQASRLPP